MFNKSELSILLRFAADLLSGKPVPAILASEQEAGASENVPPAKRPGRPPKNAQPPATETAPPEQTSTAAAVTPEPEKAPAPAVDKLKPEGAKTLEELQAIVSPIVKGNKEKGIQGQGLAVMKALNKYAPKDFEVSENNNYRLSLLAEHPEHHAEFLADMAALSI